MCVSPTVGNMALILATSASVSAVSVRESWNLSLSCETRPGTGLPRGVKHNARPSTGLSEGVL